MKESSSETVKRQSAILDIIRQQGSAGVNDLATRFAVSGTTIRTDLTKLENEGEIVRTHGGAMLRAAFTRETDMDARKNREEKAAIARKALNFVKNADCILLDTGTTMEAFARELAGSGIIGLHIYTNDIVIAGILESNPTFDIHLLGGTLRKRYHYCWGHNTIEELKNYSFDTLFFATSAMDEHYRLSTSSPELAQLKQAMIAASRKRVLLSDSSKLGKTEFQRIGSLSDVDVLICDPGVSQEEKSAMEAQGTQVVIAR